MLGLRKDSVAGGKGSGGLEWRRR